jgi:hypothetical protein
MEKKVQSFFEKEWATVGDRAQPAIRSFPVFWKDQVI